MQRNETLGRLQKKLQKKNDKKIEINKDVNDCCVKLIEQFLILDKEYKLENLKRYQEAIINILFTDKTCKHLKTTNIEENTFIQLEKMGLNNLCIKLATATDLENNETCLHYAAFINSPAYAERLIDLGVDVNAKAFDNITPLFSAAGCFDDEDPLNTLKLLVANGANPFDFNQYHESILFQLINHKRKNSFSYALTELKINPNQPDQFGNYPLHFAIQNKLFEFVQILLNNGAQMDIKDSLKRTPQMLATEIGDKNIFTLISDYLKKISNAISTPIITAVSDATTTTTTSITEKTLKQNHLLTLVKSGDNTELEKYLQKTHTLDSRTISSVLAEIEKQAIDANIQNGLHTLFITGKQRRALPITKEILEQLSTLGLHSLLENLFKLRNKNNKTLLQEMVNNLSLSIDSMLAVVELSERLTSTSTIQPNLLYIAKSLIQSNHQFIFNYPDMRLNIEIYFDRHLYEKINEIKLLHKTYLNNAFLQDLIALRFSSEFYQELLNSLLENKQINNVSVNAEKNEDLLEALRAIATPKVVALSKPPEANTSGNTQPSIIEVKSAQINEKTSSTPPSLPVTQSATINPSATSKPSNIKSRKSNSNSKSSQMHAVSLTQKKKTSYLHLENPQKNEISPASKKKKSTPPPFTFELSSNANTITHTNSWKKETHVLASNIISRDNPQSALDDLKKLITQFTLPDPASFKATNKAIDARMDEFKKIKNQAEHLIKVCGLYLQGENVTTVAKNIIEFTDNLDLMIKSFLDANTLPNKMQHIELEEKFWTLLEAIEKINCLTFSNSLQPGGTSFG